MKSTVVLLEQIVSQPLTHNNIMERKFWTSLYFDNTNLYEEEFGAMIVATCQPAAFRFLISFTKNHILTENRKIGQVFFWAATTQIMVSSSNIDKSVNHIVFSRLFQ